MPQLFASLIDKATSTGERLREHKEAIIRRTTRGEGPAENSPVFVEPSPPVTHDVPPAQATPTEATPAQPSNTTRVRRRDRVFNALKESSEVYDITMKLQEVTKSALDIVTDKGTAASTDGAKVTGAAANPEIDGKGPEIVRDTGDGGKMDAAHAVDSITLEDVITPDAESSVGIIDLITSFL